MLVLFLVACCLVPPVAVCPDGLLAAVPLFWVAFRKGGIGGGDVKAVAALGLVLGFGRTTLTLLGAMALMVAWHGMRKAVGRGEGAYPFVPFLFVSEVLRTLVEGAMYAW